MPPLGSLAFRRGEVFTVSARVSSPQNLRDVLLGDGQAKISAKNELAKPEGLAKLRTGGQTVVKR